MSQVDSVIKKLVNNSEKKIEILLKIQKSTNKQNIAIEAHNINALMDEIQLKSELIDKVNILDISFISDYKILKDMLGIESIESIDTTKYSELSALKANIFKIMNILKETKEIDDKNNKIVNIEYNELKEKMKDVNRNIKVSKGYNTTYNHVQGVFIDNKK